MRTTLALVLALAVSAPAFAQDGKPVLLSPKDVRALPATEPVATLAYGPAPQQQGELRLPPGKGPFPVAIVIHGGCWTAGYETLKGTAPMASALTAKGLATWNIEYRRVGDPGGGFPGTLQDWGAAADHLRVLAKSYPLDLKRVVAVGHSAGAHGALWIAARRKLPRDSSVASRSSLPVRAAVAIDGPADLRDVIGKDEEICGRPILTPFFGGSVTDRPEAYRLANPAELGPLGVPQHLVASSVLPPSAAEAYRAAANARGDQVEVLTLKDAGHFNMIAPGNPAWTPVEAIIVRVAKGGRGPPLAPGAPLR
jgi:acetyl esterase/lipase